jgi:hypothetical protein
MQDYTSWTTFDKGRGFKGRVQVADARKEITLPYQTSQRAAQLALKDMERSKAKAY